MKVLTKIMQGFPESFCLYVNDLFLQWFKTGMHGAEHLSHLSLVLTVTDKLAGPRVSTLLSHVNELSLLLCHIPVTFIKTTHSVCISATAAS